MGEKLVAERNVGDEFETGSRIITAAELDMFCTITGNRLSPFLQDEAAKALGFKERVVFPDLLSLLWYSGCLENDSIDMSMWQQIK